MKQIIYLFVTLFVVLSYSKGLADETVPRKDLEYLNKMFKNIKLNCLVKEITDEEIIGLRLVAEGKLGMVIYNGKIAGIKGLENQVITYMGIIDLESYEKDARFIKFYDGCD